MFPSKRTLKTKAALKKLRINSSIYLENEILCMIQCHGHSWAVFKLTQSSALL